MTTPSKTKSCFERLLSEIYARRFPENNQQVCIYCFQPRSNKNMSVKYVVALNFMCSIIKALHL